MCELCRRSFMRGVAALGAASAANASPALAQALRPPADLRTPVLPARGEFVLRNAHIMTMDPALGDFPGGSVHVRNGEIIAVGREVNAPSAQSPATT